MAMAASNASRRSPPVFQPSATTLPIPSQCPRRSSTLSAPSGSSWASLKMLARWSEKEMEEARELVEKYKEVRDVIQQGDQYRLLSPRAGDTTAVQYVSRDRSRSVLFVLRSSHQWPDPVPTIYPRGLEPGRVYRTTAEKGPVSGQALMNRGIKVSLEGELSSTMVEITEE